MQEDESHRGAEADKVVPVSHVGRKRNDSIHMKILVPSGAVGAIIGKGGESIAEVQWVTGARIKLSKPNDFYPGTMERVCLIQGTLEGITRMHNYIMDRMLEKPECAGPSGAPAMLPSGAATGSGAPRFGAPSTILPSGIGDQPSGSGVPGDTSAVSTWPMMTGSRLPWGRHQQVKILVPNCTAGLVIGKVGSYVKEIKDRTGAFIQVSQKSKEINLLERCITIAGEPDQCRAAVALVLAKIAEDPQSTSCPTISYSRVQGPVASAYPTGSPFAFTSLPRFPSATAPQAPHAPDITQSTAPYGTAAEAYMSPAFQAALLQAAALALSQRSYYQQHQMPHAGFTTATPQVPAAPSQQQSSSQVASSTPRIGEYGVPSGAGAVGEVGVYTPIAQSLPTQFVPPGATGMWPAYEGGWSTGAEHAVPGLATPPSAAGAASFEHAYPTHLNLTYYPTNQPLLAHMPSRHAGETYSIGTEVFSPSPFGASVPIPANLRVTSPVCGATPLTAFYPSLYSHPAAEPGGSGGGGGTAGKVPPSTVPLSDLFASLRLSGVNYPEMTGPELGQLFSTLSQHPGLVGLTGGYQMMSSPTMPGPVLPTLPFPSGLTTQAPSGPATGHSQHGTSFDATISAPYSSVPSADPRYSGRPPGTVPISGASCVPTSDLPVPVIARRPDRGGMTEGSRHHTSKSTDDDPRSSTVRPHRKKSKSPHQSPPRLSPRFDSSSTYVAPSIPTSLTSPVLPRPQLPTGPSLVDTDQPTSESPELTSHSQSDPVSADVSSSHSSCSPDHKPVHAREACHRGACLTKFKSHPGESRLRSEQSSSTKPCFNGQIVGTTTATNGLTK